MAATAPGGSLNHRNTEISAEPGEPELAIEPVTARPTTPTAITTHGHLPPGRCPSAAIVAMVITGRRCPPTINRRA